MQSKYLLQYYIHCNCNTNTVFIFISISVKHKQYFIKWTIKKILNLNHHLYMTTYSVRVGNGTGWGWIPLFTSPSFELIYTSRPCPDLHRRIVFYPSSPPKAANRNPQGNRIFEPLKRTLALFHTIFSQNPKTTRPFS